MINLWMIYNVDTMTSFEINTNIPIELEDPLRELRVFLRELRVFLREYWYEAYVITQKSDTEGTSRNVLQ